MSRMFFFRTVKGGSARLSKESCPANPLLNHQRRSLRRETTVQHYLRRRVSEISGTDRRIAHKTCIRQEHGNGGNGDLEGIRHGNGGNCDLEEGVLVTIWKATKACGRWLLKNSKSNSTVTAEYAQTLNNTVSIRKSLQNLIFGEGFPSPTETQSSLPQSETQSSLPQSGTSDNPQPSDSHSPAQDEGTLTQASFPHLFPKPNTQDEFPPLPPRPKIDGMNIFASFRVCSPADALVVVHPVNELYFKVEMTDSLSGMKLTVEHVPYKLFCITDVSSFFEDGNRLNLLMRQRIIKTPSVRYGDLIKDCQPEHNIRVDT